VKLRRDGTRVSYITAEGWSRRGTWDVILIKDSDSRRDERVDDDFDSAPPRTFKGLSLPRALTCAP
jgi:hypothetical protein